MLLRRPMGIQIRLLYLGRLRDALVVFEVAASVVLLVGNGLMVRSFASVGSTNPGYDTHGVLTIRLALPYGAFPEPEDRQAPPRLHVVGCRRSQHPRRRPLGGPSVPGPERPWPAAAGQPERHPRGGALRHHDRRSGVYGVLSNLVAQRTRAIGIRMALGQGPGGARGEVVGQMALLPI